MSTLRNFAKIKYILTVIIAVACVIAGFVFLNDPKEIKAGWWNDSWSYRQAIPVTNNTSEESDVYIIVTLNTFVASTSMQSDCGDFRFIKENGETLPYYIVSGCQTDTNVIHINFSTFPAGAQNVYFYYGNPGAANGFSASDFTVVASDYTIGATQSEEVGPGPVGYWSFDKGYGTTAQDSSSNNNDGTITGATWQDESMCVSGRCLYFDGDTDWVDIINDASLNFGDDEGFSFSVWVKFSGTDTEQQIFRSSNVNAYYLERQDTGKIRYQVNSDPDVYSSDLNDGQWHYLTATRDGSSGVLAFYVDGNPDGTPSGTNSSSVTETDDYRIGGRQNGTGDFNGFIDEVKIYPYARTADQIRQDYAAGLAGISSAHGVSASFGGTSDKWMSDGLVGYWQMDESATTSGAFDASGNGNDGTYYGDASTTAGKFGNGGVFDGDDDYINCGNDSSLNMANVVTVAVWVYPNDFGGGYDAYVIKGNTNYELGSNGDELGITFFNGSYQNHYTSGENYANDQWYHVVGIIDNNNDKVQLYVNGELVVDDVETTNMITNSSNLIIGADTGASQEMQGKLDEVRIYNRALSPDEVRKLYEWAPGPVAHWKFDEKTGVTAYDSVASSSFVGGNNGTIDGATWTRGKYGGALNFDGSDDYVDMGPPYAVTDFSKNFTVTAWVNSNTISGSHQIVSTDSDMQFYISNDDLRYITNSDITQASNVFTTGAWFFVGVTYNGTDITLYVDGNVEATETKTAVYNGNRNNYIGVYAVGASSEFWDGLIDDVRIYNYARTRRQILADMAGGQAQKQPVLDLKFDECFGETAHDSSIHDNDGTLTPGGSGGNSTVSEMWDKNGKFGSAMEFDGDNDYVDIGDINIASSTSFAFWLKPDSTTENIMDFDGGTHTITVSNGVISANNFINPIIYVDGDISSVIDTSWHYLAITADYGIDVNNMDVGRISSNYFDGLIDEVKIYNYALSVDEVKTLYNQGQAAIMGSPVKHLSGATGQGMDYCIPGDTATCSPPVLELKMDEKSGTTTYDTSGQGNDGAFVSSVSSPTWTRGKYGSALSFDGSDDYVVLGDLNTFDDLCLGSGCSFNFWMYIPSGESGAVISRYDDSGSNGFFAIFATTNGDIDFWLSDDGAGVDCDTPNVGQDFAFDEWEYITVVYDNVSNTATNWLNGAPVWSTACDITINEVAWQDGESTFISGYDNGGPGGSPAFALYGGNLDHVRIYDYARTPAQVAWDYNKGKPIAHWKFDECSGGTIHNATHNTQHGTLHLGTAGVTATGTCASSSDSFWYNGRDGKINSGGSFDGGSDYVDCGDTGYDINSISFWLKADSNSEYIIDLDNGTRYVRANNGVITATGFSSPTIYVDGEQSSVIDTAWHHILIKTSTAIDANNMDIGRVGANYFDGLIDEVKIFNYALTAEQMRTEYNGGAVRFAQ